MSKKYATDLEIAEAAKLKPIGEIAKKLGLDSASLELYGPYKAKIPLDQMRPDKIQSSNLILVSAITPTPSGEGKTTTSIGLCEGLNRIGKNATVVLREPSLGPVFGIKGGAAGGGYSQVVPMVDINLHFTGDFSAIEKANNLLSALIDNNIHQAADDVVKIDPRSVVWKRVMDMNERALRNIVTGLGGKAGGVPKESGFNITAASEIMAILCLADNLSDLKQKMGNIYVGDSVEGKAVFARDLNAQGAMTILLKDAIKPNLVQTMEGNPAIIHGGPFANIAQGTNSVVATKMGLSWSDFVVTEAGFGADLGAEKFFDIKCGYAGLSPKAVVLTTTIRALKYHGGVARTDLNASNVTALEAGLPNMEKHIENLRSFGIPVVISINRFPTDSEEEVARLRKACETLGVSVALGEGWMHGGAGMEELAEKVVQAVESCKQKYIPVYDWNDTVENKIVKVAKSIYGAESVVFGRKARLNLKRIKRLGLDHLPICIAKTQASISDNPKLLGRPTGFELTVREIEIAAGAGFLIPITGDIMRMPGLPKVPAAQAMDIDENGVITGLS
ncbi:MAG: formate--tetrahydrofolate ligase [Limisphaerales bacterium]|jgi:formate--tetrahydrofolate ligase